MSHSEEVPMNMNFKSKSFKLSTTESDIITTLLCTFLESYSSFNLIILCSLLRTFWRPTPLCLWIAQNVPFQFSELRTGSGIFIYGPLKHFSHMNRSIRPTRILLFQHSLWGGALALTMQSLSITSPVQTFVYLLIKIAGLREICSISLTLDPWKWLHTCSPNVSID
jgi:hypothetical protein